MRVCLLSLVSLIILLQFPQSGFGQEDRPMNAFLNSCLLGVGVGSLLGVASLAVSEDPSARTNHIARGASYGLYAGIGLGLYRAYQLNQEDAINKDGDYSLLFLPQMDGPDLGGRLDLVVQFF
jgi:hypothetical protein